MISFQPTDEQKMLVDSIRRYSEADVRKVAHEADEQDHAPDSVIGKGWELGLLPGLIPEAYGGYADEQPAVTGVLALEELAWGDLGIALKVWAPANFALAVLLAGTEAQKEEYLPLFCDIDRPHMTVGLIEPHPLFDPWRPKTQAVVQGDKVTLSGEKAYVPMADGAEKLIIFASDSETGKVDGYIVESGSAGLEVGEREKLMGVKALPVYRIKLNDVAVPLVNRLGGEAGTNFPVILNRSRIALGAMGVGVARASLEYSVEYAKGRIQFGVPIATKQAIAFRIAKVAIEVDAARMLVWEAAWQADQGKELTALAAQVKAQVNKMVMFATDSGVQILGGYGYIREYPVERWLRHARGIATFDGLALV